MTFNSIQYILFLLPAVAVYYLFSGRLRNLILLCASLYFYYCWGWQYPVLLVVGILLSFFFGRAIAKAEGKKRTAFLTLGLILNLGILVAFKYLNFFGYVVNAVFDASLPASSLVLTVGISFWVFQACSYLIDVSRGTVPPESSLIDFALYLAFFPQLIQGPIERAKDLLPQLKAESRYDPDCVSEGLTLLVWGMMKKVLLADNLAVVANTVFRVPAEYSGMQIVFALFCYTFQIYLDFSGYTDMAKGSAALFGIRLRDNFRSPYFATGIRDFWKRWHISLTSWFRDYLYIPLGGSRVAKWRHLLNILIVFAVSGLWHGAAMTFVVWGLLHGVLQCLEILLESLRKRPPKDGRLRNALRTAGTFLIVNYTWLFFRADSLSDAVFMTKRMMLIPVKGVFPLAFGGLGLTRGTLLVCAVFLVLVFAVEALKEKTGLLPKFNKCIWPRYAVYTVLILATLLFGYYGAGFDPQDFVYFKF